MACRVQDKTINDVLKLLVAEGFEGMADAMSIMLNEAMRLDRSWHLGAATGAIRSGSIENQESRPGSDANRGCRTKSGLSVDGNPLSNIDMIGRDHVRIVIKDGKVYKNTL